MSSCSLLSPSPTELKIPRTLSPCRFESDLRHQPSPRALSRRREDAVWQCKPDDACRSCSEWAFGGLSWTVVVVHRCLDSAFDWWPPVSESSHIHHLCPPDL